MPLEYGGMSAIIGEISMQWDFTVKLPYPPSVNHIWNIGRGHLWNSKKYTQFKSDVALILKNYMRNNDFIPGAFYIANVIVFPPDRRRRDLDNIQKALFDAVTASGVIWDDDSQIVGSISLKGAPAVKPFVIFKALALGSDADIVPPTKYGGTARVYKK